MFSRCQIKAAFLLNFVRYVEWPSSAFEAAGTPLVLCVLEQNPFGNALERTVAGEIAGGRSLEVRLVPTVQQANGCHLLFFPHAAPLRASSATSETGTAPTLTVGESADFIQMGGIINLVTVAGRVRFEVNVGAAERRGLRISSRLLRLAVTIHQS